jgi:hypothetical protein
MKRIITALRLSALLGGWRPIKTAPMDGTRFIGYRDGLVWTTYAGRYYEKWPHEQGGPTFRVEMTRDEGGSLVPYSPTHWMPLPDVK